MIILPRQARDNHKGTSKTDFLFGVKTERCSAFTRLAEPVSVKWSSSFPSMVKWTNTCVLFLVWQYMCGCEGSPRIDIGR